MNWQSVSSVDPGKMAKGSPAIIATEGDAILLVVSTGRPDAFSLRMLLDRMPDFGLQAFIRQGEDLGWPTDGFITLGGVSGSPTFPLHPGQMFGKVISDDPMFPFIIREMWTPRS